MSDYLALIDSLPDLTPDDERKKGASLVDRLPDTTKPATALDRAQATAAGVNRGALASLPGMPVDTVLNVWDLLKAAYGAAGRATGALKPEDMPGLTDRASIPMSSDWLASHERRAGIGVDPQRPDDAASRALFAGGQGVGSSLVGPRVPPPTPLPFLAARVSLPQAFKNATMAGTSSGLGNIVGEATDNPALGILASLGPQAVATGAPEAVRRTFRGGEDGRRTMADRLKVFDEAGVDPTVGLATGNRRTQALEAFFNKFPGGSGVMQRKNDAMREQLGATVAAARDDVSPTHGDVQAGMAVQKGAKGYEQRIKDAYRYLDDQVQAQINPSMIVQAPQSVAASQRLIAPLPGAPALSQNSTIRSGAVQGVARDLISDVAPTLPQIVASAIRGPNGQPFTTVIPGTPGGVPFSTLTAVNRAVGAQLPGAKLAMSPDEAQWSQLWGALKGDRADAIAAASPSAKATFNKANRLYSNGMDRLDLLKPFYNAASPEQAFGSLERSAQNAGTITRDVMKSLRPQDRATVTATVIDNLGRDARNDTFSPRLFLSNWNRLTDEGRAALFSGHPAGGGTQESLSAVARAADMIDKAGKVYANPSGTAPAGTQAAVIGSAAGAAASGNVGMLTKVLGSVVLANRGAALMTNPVFTHWLARSTNVPESRVQQHLQRLAANSTQIKDPDVRGAIDELLRELQQGSQQ